MQLKINAIAQRLWPAGRFPDTTEGNVRMGGDGSLYTLPLVQTSHMLADEGNYFVATNPTPGTGIAAVTSLQSLTEASPVLILKNNDVATNPSYKRIYLDYIRLIVTAVGASSTNLDFAIKLDNNANKYTSGGSVLTATNVNMDVSTGSIALCYFGALAAVTSTGSARIVHRSHPRTTIPVIGDEYILKFGSVEFATSFLTSSAGAYQQTINGGPLIIGPNQTATLYEWSAASGGAPSFEVEIGWWER